MAQASKTFRIFVSSTFSDLKEERNALQQYVFPKLWNLCMQHGCRFQAIDLRWGVSGEAALDQQTMNICLEELKRCQTITPRPNFIVLLGDRYGWRPLPPQIEAEEFEVILDNVPPEDRELLLWDEQQPNDRKGWYRKDENAVPAEYCLRPREVKVPENATDEERKAALDSEDEEWGQIERKLRSTILQAVDKLGWPDDDPRWIKYEDSATHQEILSGALGVPDAHEHVYCFFRKIGGLPHEPEAKDFLDLDESGHLDEEAQDRLKSLKKNLRDRLPDNYFEYKASWTGDGATTEHIGDLPDNIENMLKQDDAGKGLGKLCLDVYACLSRVILKQIEHPEKPDALDAEITAHNNFGQERARFFTGRASILQSIGDYLKGTDSHPLAIFGESGSGKTALMARATQRTRETYPDAEVVFRFIGATPSSSDGRSLLESLCRQISRCYGADETMVPSDYRELVQELPNRLALATKEKPLIVFLDALNQLSDTDNARDLSWLPTDLPENVRLVVSVLPGECLSVLQGKLPTENLVELKPMPPEEGQELLNLWLEDAGRSLQEHQRDEVLGKFSQCGLPLYLKLAFEEARRWKSYTEKIELSQDIPSVIGDLFKRLSLETNHGEMMVSRSLGYLAAAKNGLTEDEILDVLSHDSNVMADFKRRLPKSPEVDKLPVVVWSRLYMDLEPYLTERAADGTSLMTFYHTQVGEATNEEFLAGEAKRKRHEGLAHYFGAQALHIVRDGRKISNLRKLSELPYQQTYGELWDGVEQTLCDLHFVEAKCAAGMTYDLIADYNAALNALPEAQEERQKELEHEARIKKYTEDLIAYAKGEIDHLDIIPSVEPWSDERIKEDIGRIINNPTRLDRMRAFSQFVNSESYALVKFASHPSFVLQQAYNSAGSGPVASAAEATINAGVDDILLLQDPNQRPDYNPHPALLRTLEGHTDGVTSVSVTPDGKKAVSGSDDKTLRVWDLESGECLRTLKGHIWSVNSVSVTPDGKKAVSGSNDKTLRVWDLESGKCLRTLKGHADPVNSVSVTSDGKRAVSGSNDMTLRVWALESGKCLRTLKGHTGYVNSVSVTPDGKRAISGSGDETLRVWDLENPKWPIIINVSGVRSMSITSDGKFVLAVIGQTLRLGDLKTAEHLVKLAGRREIPYLPEALVGHEDYVAGASVTPDGKIAISGGGPHDPTVRVWDLGNRRLVGILGDHLRAVRTVSITADGKRAVSGSDDKTLRVWDSRTGRRRETLGVLPGGFQEAITPNGRRAVSRSGDNKLRVWDLESGKCLRILEGHTAEVNSVSFTPDGKRAVSGSDDKTLRVWDLESGECLRILEGLTEHVYSVNITPDGRRAVLRDGFEIQFLPVWDLQTGKCVRTLRGHTDRIDVSAITPDGRRAVSASFDKTLRVWDLESKECLRTIYNIYNIPESVFAIDVTPDGKIIVVTFAKTLGRWELETGLRLKVLEGYEYHWHVRMAPDGRRAISHSDDKTMRLWDLQTGKCLGTLGGHTDRVYYAKITPDGKRAISGSYDKTLRVWDLENGDCIAVYQAEGLVFPSPHIRPSGHFGVSAFFVLHNFPMASPVVTPVRIWLYGELRDRLFGRKAEKGRWDDDIKATCQWCGQRFPVSEEILHVIRGVARDANLSPDQSPCLELPTEAWEEPRLLSECPTCHRPLKFNPFIVDNRG